MNYGDRVLTETYRDKRYEEDLTKMYFEVMKRLEAANYSPNLMNVRLAFGAANTFCDALVYSKKHLEVYRDRVKPVMADIQTILYGDYKTRQVMLVAGQYDAGIARVRGEDILKNGIKVLNKISEVVFVVKQWAYEEGLLLPKPVEKKLGVEGIENTLMQ